MTAIKYVCMFFTRQYTPSSQPADIAKAMQKAITTLVDEVQHTMDQTSSGSLDEPDELRYLSEKVVAAATASESSYSAQHMKWCRFKRNPARCPEAVAEKMGNGENWFQIWMDKGNPEGAAWGEMVMQKWNERLKRNKIENVKGDMTVEMLNQKYGLATSDAIIKHKTELGEYRDNPDCPGNVGARIFTNCWVAGTQTKSDESTDGQGISGQVNLGRECASSVAQILTRLDVSNPMDSVPVIGSGEPAVTGVGKPRKPVVRKPKTELELSISSLRVRVSKLAARSSEIDSFMPILKASSKQWPKELAKIMINQKAQLAASATEGSQLIGIHKTKPETVTLDVVHKLVEMIDNLITSHHEDFNEAKRFGKPPRAVAQTPKSKTAK